MAIAPAIKPQETKPAPLPAYPVAPPSHTQTSARGMVPPKKPAHFAEGTTTVQPSGNSKIIDAINSVTPQGVAVSGFSSLFDKAMNDATAKPVQHFAEGGTVQPGDPGVRIGAPTRILDPNYVAPPAADTNRFAPQNEGATISNAINAVKNAGTPVTAQRFTPAAEAGTGGGIGAMLHNARDYLSSAVFGGPAAPAPATAAPAAAAPAAAAPTAAPSALPHDAVAPEQVAALPESLAARMQTSPQAGGFDLSQARHDILNHAAGLPAGGRGMPAPGQPVPVPTAQDQATVTDEGPVAAQPRHAPHAASQHQLSPAQQHAIGAPSAYLPDEFVKATRGMNLHQMQMMWGMQHYDPKTAVFNALIGQQGGRLAGMPKGDARNAALIELEREMQTFSGSAPYVKTYNDGTTDQTDENGNPVQ